MITRLSYGLGLFIGSLVGGWWLGRAAVLSDARAGALIRLTIRWLSPLTLALSFWQLHVDRGLLLLPAAGMLVAVLSLLPAGLYAASAGLSRPQAGSFLTCAMFSNLGFLGAFIGFAMFGEPAYALAQVHLLFFSPAFYVIGFGLASRLGSRSTSSPAGSTSGGDELRFFPLIGLLAGLGLHLARIPRPPLFEALNHILIPATTILYLMAIGSQLVIEPWRGSSARPHLVMGLIKFIYSPLVGWLLAWLFGLTGLPRFIVLLQASMPVAISPLMLPLLFGIDRKLTTSLWLSTTLLAIAWLPLYVLLLRA